MLGAIVGDIIGSIYESRRNRIKTTEFPLFSDNCRFTDDTVLTFAIYEAMKAGGKPDDFVRFLKLYGRKYPRAGYGAGFKAWMFGDDDNATRDSFANGAAMRVSPVVMFAETLKEAEEWARRSAANTHCHTEGIKGAQAIAAACFMAANKKSKEEISAYVKARFKYDLNRKLADIRPNYPRYDLGHRASMAAFSVPEAIIAFMESDSFESAVRNAVSLGGDADTQAAMAGAIAEHYYGIPDYIKAKAFIHLPDELENICHSLPESTKRKRPRFDFTCADNFKDLIEKHGKKMPYGYTVSDSRNEFHFFDDYGYGYGNGNGGRDKIGFSIVRNVENKNYAVYDAKGNSIAGDFTGMNIYKTRNGIVLKAFCRAPAHIPGNRDEWRRMAIFLFEEKLKYIHIVSYGDESGTDAKLPHIEFYQDGFAGNVRETGEKPDGRSGLEKTRYFEYDRQGGRPVERMTDKQPAMEIKILAVSG